MKIFHNRKLKELFIKRCPLLVCNGIFTLVIMALRVKKVTHDTGILENILIFLKQICYFSQIMKSLLDVCGSLRN